MNHEFVVMHNIRLHKLPSPVYVEVIDGRPIASSDIVEESEPIRVVLGNLARVISFNIISSPECWESEAVCAEEGSHNVLFVEEICSREM